MDVGDRQRLENFKESKRMGDVHDLFRDSVSKAMVA